MVRHVASVADIVTDVDAAVHFYREVLGLPVEREEGAPYAAVKVPGILHFGIWHRAAAAESVFGDAARADEVPLGLSLGFEVDEVGPATVALADGGAALLQPARPEPWGQVTARFLLPGGALGEVAETPWARHLTQPMIAGGE